MKKISRLLALAGMIAFLVTGCKPEVSGGSTPVQENKVGAISGKVVYSNSTDSSDILVSIEKSDGLITESVANVAGLTDGIAIEAARSAARSVLGQKKAAKDGSYSFENLAPGLYTVYASSNISKERAVTTNVSVKANQTVNAADLNLTATGSISGKVQLDGSGKAGFIVNLAGTSFMAVTGEDGSFIISDVPAGTEYNLSVLFGTYTYIVTGKVKTEAGKTKDVATISLTTDEIKNKSLISDGKDGTNGSDGTNGKDGENGKDGISITWLGSFASEDEIENPVEMNAYYNTEDGCSYIYVNGKWELLASAGKNGENGKDANAESHISVSQNEKGINFSGTILSNVYTTYNGRSSDSANVSITIRNDTTGICMIQDWNKTAGAWDSWSLTYPLVEKGKEYNFTVTVANTNWTLYQEKFTVTAEGGLGELKVENADKIGTILDSDRVIKRTEKPVFTDNANIRIISKGTNYEFYRDELWSGMWLYGIELWDGQYDESLPVKDLQKISGWRSFDWIDKVLKGHKYVVRGYTKIKIAGFTYNDTVLFEMNDASQSSDDWGGALLKVAVVFAYPIEQGNALTEVKDLPGEKLTFVMKNEAKTEEYKYTYNAIIVNYGDSIEEPVNAPYFEDAVYSKFNYWQELNGSRISFPCTLAPSDDYLFEGITCTVDGQEMTYGLMLVPNITVTFTATLMDGDTKVGTEIYAPGDLLKTKPEAKDGLSFGGWYTDKECTKKFDSKSFGNVTVYALWKEKAAALEGFVAVDSGSFTRSNGYSVTVSDFIISDHEVTQAEYVAVMGTNPSNYSGNSKPVETVSWYDAIYFCNKKSVADGLTPCYSVYGSTDVDDWSYTPHNGYSISGTVSCNFSANGYRLPTEAEWEFAARGGNESKGYTYSGSNNIDDVAWYLNNSSDGTKEVKTKAPNELGIYDMSGNVWEWCWDWYGSYSYDNETDPLGASSGSCRVRRGGSWGVGSGNCEVSSRGSLNPCNRSHYIGLRLVRSSSN